MTEKLPNFPDVRFKVSNEDQSLQGPKSSARVQFHERSLQRIEPHKTDVYKKILPFRKRQKRASTVTETSEQEDEDSGEILNVDEDVELKRNKIATKVFSRVKDIKPDVFEFPYYDTALKIFATRNTHPFLKDDRYKFCVLVRCAERVDRIFPDWLEKSFDDKGRYCPNDINMPFLIPERRGGQNDYHNDSPITELGKMTAQMLGRGLQVSDFGPTVIYSSPALRCIQTANEIARVYGPSGPKIRIENGLFEYCRWYEHLPDFMTPQELEKLGYAIDMEYEPLTKVEHLKKFEGKESMEWLSYRLRNCVKHITSSVGSGHHILIVAHCVTIDEGARLLLSLEAQRLYEEKLKKKNKLEEHELKDLGVRYPYCCSVALTRRGDVFPQGWAVVDGIIPPITYLDYDNRYDGHFMNRPHYHFPELEQPEWKGMEWKTNW